MLLRKLFSKGLTFGEGMIDHGPPVPCEYSARVSKFVPVQCSPTAVHPLTSTQETAFRTLFNVVPLSGVGTICQTGELAAALAGTALDPATSAVVTTRRLAVSDRTLSVHLLERMHEFTFATLLERFDRRVPHLLTSGCPDLLWEQKYMR
jgi:hypothetical protein